MRTRVEREKTFGYWYAFNKCFGVCFALGRGKKIYTFVGNVEDYYGDKPYEYKCIVVVREIGSINYTTLHYDEIKNKRISIIK